MGKMMMLLRFVVVFAALANALPSDMCGSHLKDAGVSTRFDETVAHAIHSITANELMKFSKDVTPDNGIPTVNRAISLEPSEKVLPNAPHVEVPHDFVTEAMNLFDLTLTHATDHSDGLGNNWNALERVAHAFHMRDLWGKVRLQYTTITNVTDTACDCLLNTKDNGIHARLEWIAQEYTHNTPISLHEWGSKIPKLTLATWPEWKKRLSYYYDPQSVKDAAVFLACALNRDSVTTGKTN